MHEPESGGQGADGGGVPMGSQEFFAYPPEPDLPKVSHRRYSDLALEAVLQRADTEMNLLRKAHSRPRLAGPVLHQIHGEGNSAGAARGGGTCGDQVTVVVRLS
jgi:hypothetical protein